MSSIPESGDLRRLRLLTVITQIINYANVVVVHPSEQATSVKELITYAKSQPDKLSYSHPGTGTAQQLAVELFELTAGVDITSVPYCAGQNAGCSDRQAQCGGRKIVRQPEVKELALGVASESVGNSPRAANVIVRDETALWAKVVKTVGVKIE